MTGLATYILRITSEHVILSRSHWIVAHLLLRHGLRHTSLELIREATHILKALIHWLHWCLGASVKSIAHRLHASLKLVESALTALHTHHTSAILIHLWLLLLLLLLLLLMLLCIFLLLSIQNGLKLKHGIIVGCSESISIEITLLLLLLRLRALGCSTKLKASKTVSILLLRLLWPLLWRRLWNRATTAKHV